MPVPGSVYLEDSCLRKALALITFFCWSSLYIHFNPDPMVSFAVVHKGIRIEGHAANQRKALHLDILKTQKPGFRPQLGHWRGVCGVRGLFAHLNLFSWHDGLLLCWNSTTDTAQSLFICWLASQLFPRFSWNHSSYVSAGVMGTPGCMLQLPFSK